MPLSRKILSLALLNLFLIVIVVATFAVWQFGLSFESLLLGPGRDRIMAITNAVARDLDATPQDGPNDGWTGLLAEYSRRYSVAFSLVDPQGHFIAGAKTEFPEGLIERIRTGLRPGRDGPDRRKDKGKGKEDYKQGRAPEADPAEGDPEGRPPREEESQRGEPPNGRPPDRPALLTVTRNPLTYWVGVGIPINAPDGPRDLPAILLLRAASIFNANLFFDWSSVLWLMSALAGVALLCWWPFVRGVTGSIREMDHATKQIAQGRFDSHVILERRDELGHLGEQINRMAGRLEGFVKHQKRFLGDIAHELSAPIARIQFALGILEQRVDSPQQTHVAVLRDEIQEMSALVNELLVFSKAGMQPGQAPLRSVELAPVVARAVSHQVPGAGTIQADIPAGLFVMAHEPYLLRAVSNLLRNALRYAGEAGPIMVSAGTEGNAENQVTLTVADCGPGLPEESFDEVFAPFYRPEASRSRDTGGAGLGLAIVKSCVEACRGTVVCRNRNPSGLEVAITLTRADAGPAQ